MKLLFIAILAPLLAAIAGCLSLNMETVEARCQQASILYATFVASREGTAAQKAQARDIYMSVEAFCANPTAINSNNLPVKLAELYAAIREVTR